MSSDSIEDIIAQLEPEKPPVEVNGDASELSDVQKRVIRKAKRPSQMKNGELNGNVKPNGSVKNGQQRERPSYISKSRRPRNGKGSRIPKKGGGGGKHTWGNPGCELMGAAVDRHDPNYDSDSQDEIVYESTQPRLTVDELDQYVEPIIKEYFEHGDTVEVVYDLEGFNLEDDAVRKAILILVVRLALERHSMHREMSSQLLADLHSHQVLSSQDIAQGFLSLLEDVNDLLLDTPEALQVIGNFIARAVADDCIPVEFVATMSSQATTKEASEALQRAEYLLAANHGWIKLDNVWGTGGGIRPVKVLVNKMQMLLKEYLDSFDIQEAMRCLKELEVPHFHHELVYEAVIMVIEDSSDQAAANMVKLLKFMCDAVLITVDQLERGFDRAIQALPELSVDVPNTFLLTERFVLLCTDAGFMSTSLADKLPGKGRKRFVSEGDGGLIKS